MWIGASGQRSVIDRPGRCQLLQAGISEQQSCYCQSSVLVHCATQTYAHGRAHTNANDAGHTRIRARTDTPHSHTPYLSLGFAPAVRSQLGNEAVAFFPFLHIEPEKLLIASTRCSQLQQAGQPTWGSISWGAENIQTRLPVSV